jgi:hypothetical protein
LRTFGVYILFESHGSYSVVSVYKVIVVKQILPLTGQKPDGSILKMRKFIVVLLAVLFCSCEESKYAIHIANNTGDPARAEAGQTVRYALAKDPGIVHNINQGGKAVHEVSFGVPYGIEFYEPMEGKPRNIGLRYTGDDSYEFYTLEGLPLWVSNTLNFDVQLSCDRFLNVEEPLLVPAAGQNFVPAEASGSGLRIYTQAPNFSAVLNDSEDKEGQRHFALVTFTVIYNDDGEAEQIVAEIR